MNRLLCFLGWHSFTPWHDFLDFRTGGMVRRRRCFACGREEER